MQQAHFRSTDFSHSTFQAVILYEADLSDADLRDAIIHNSNLSGANLATMPDGRLNNSGC
jgi:uncharacterized protein YjbI with pentapeptide repeats